MEQGYEFITVRDLWGERLTEEGQIEEYLMKKDVKAKWYCRDLNQISSFSQVINEKGNLRPGKTMLNVGGEVVMVQMKYNDVKNILQPRKIKGLSK